MKKILLITTGGTISSAQTETGLAPVPSDRLISEVMKGLSGLYQIDVKDLFHLDSSNIQPEEWQQIGRTIAEIFENYDGVVVAHGTDTMGYSASALSFMLKNIPIPIVFTGSQLPLIHPLSDGLDNLRCAFAMAASQDACGVFVAFDRKIILGCRAVKVRTSAFNAFESVNAPYAAIIDSGGLQLNRDLIKKPDGPFALEDGLCPNVFLVKLTPGFNPAIFDMLLQMNYRGVVIEAFGTGGLHYIRRNLIAKLEAMVDSGISVVICSQCLYEKSELTIYQIGQKLLDTGVIQGYDMTTEAAVTKLMWALAGDRTPEQVKRLFSENLAGEISIPQ